MTSPTKPAADTGSITDQLVERATAMAPLLPDILAIQQHAKSAMVVGAIRALVRTGAAEHFRGPADTDLVARAAGLDSLALLRMVRFLEGEGFFEYVSGRTYRLSGRGRLLVDPPMAATFRFTGTLDALGGLGHTLRTGESAFVETFGTDFWSWLSVHPHEELAFADTMKFDGTVLNLPCVPLIAVHVGDVVADIGGGIGELLGAMLEANPEARGILVDQEAVLRRALPALTGGSLSSRCQLWPQSLFDPPPTADLYLMARILHDWSDADAGRLLKAARSSAAPGGRLVVLEMAIPDEPGPHAAKVSDIGMMTLFGAGRERTVAEFRSLLLSSGWRLETVQSTMFTTIFAASAS
jgi:hypothetical protein